MRSKLRDLAFVLLMGIIAWIVFGGGRWIMDLEVGL